MARPPSRYLPLARRRAIGYREARHPVRPRPMPAVVRRFSPPVGGSTCVRLARGPVCIRRGKGPACTRRSGCSTPAVSRLPAMARRPARARSGMRFITTARPSAGWRRRSASTCPRGPIRHSWLSNCAPPGSSPRCRCCSRRGWRCCLRAACWRRCAAWPMPRAAWPRAITRRGSRCARATRSAAWPAISTGWPRRSKPTRRCAAS